jgi:hypothetical protein
MPIEAGFIIMVAGFVAVWLIFVVYGEVAIARDRRRETATAGQDGDDARA